MKSPDNIDGPFPESPPWGVAEGTATSALLGIEFPTLQTDTRDL